MVGILVYESIGTADYIVYMGCNSGSVIYLYRGSRNFIWNPINCNWNFMVGILVYESIGTADYIVYMGCNSGSVIYLYRGSRNFKYVPPGGKAIIKCSSCHSRCKEYGIYLVFSGGICSCDMDCRADSGYEV